MRGLYIVIYLSIYIYTAYCVDILSLFEYDARLGEIEQTVLQLSANQTNQQRYIQYRLTQCGDSEKDIVYSYIQNRVSETIDLSSLSVVGGCGHQSVLPQITCSSSSLVEVINLQLTINSFLQPIYHYIKSQNIQQVGVVLPRSEEKNSINQEMTTLAADLSNKFNIIINLLKQSSSDVVSDIPLIILDESVNNICDHTRSNPLIIIQVNIEDLELSCLENRHHVVLDVINSYDDQRLDSLRSDLSLKGYSDLTQSDMKRAACLYDSMNIMTSLNGDVRESLAGTTFSGITGRIVFDRNTQRLLPVNFHTYKQGDKRLVASWTADMGLNVTDNGTLSHYDADISSEWTNHRLVILIIMSSLSLLTFLYTLAIIIFNCAKSKDRTIKLTSPNINLVTCLGCILMLISIPMFCTESPVTSNTQHISQLRQAAQFVYSNGLTLILSSILVKTWRVHYIFKKMHVSSKGTKDEHLLLMIIIILVIDISVNIGWLKSDHIICTYHNTYAQDNITTVLRCSSRYQIVWSCILLSYKCTLGIAILVYAWNVRNVKLPSLKDSQFLLSLCVIVISSQLLLISMYIDGEIADNSKSLILSLSAVIIVVSAISLLLTPKMFLLKNPDKSKSAVKFLFSESMLKMKAKEEPKAQWACFKACVSQSGSTMGDSVLSQEIETLKQLVKEKDESIRELTDRLFFGADRFKAYVHEKTHRTSSQSSQDSVRTNYTTLQNQHSHKRQMTSYAQRSQDSFEDFSQATYPLSNKHHQTMTQSQPYSTSSLTSTTRPTHHSKTLPPIRELKPDIEPDGSTSPTIDSAINMTPSNSSASSNSDLDDETTRRESGEVIQTISDRINGYRRCMSSGGDPQELYSTPDQRPTASSAPIVGEEIVLEFVFPKSKGYPV